MGIFNRYKGIYKYNILDVVNEKRTPLCLNGAPGLLSKIIFEVLDFLKNSALTNSVRKVKNGFPDKNQRANKDTAGEYT